MARIELNIVALGDFASVNSQVKALQAQVDLLNKSLTGVGMSNELSKNLAAAQSAFRSTMLSTGQFTMQTVAMTSETEKFGQALVSGKLKLSDYFNIITKKSSEATTSLAALTAEQVKLSNSVVMTDPMKKGFMSVYTPTQINAVTDATKLAAMQQDMYNLSLRASSTALVNWGKNTQWAGRQLTVGLTMPMVMFGSAAVKSFKDTNLELTKLQRLYGEGLTPPSQAQINQISGQVLNLGKQVAEQMGIAQTETVKVAANFAAMGHQGKDLLDTTYQTQRLSKLGAVDAASATNTVVALQNVYKVSAGNLANAVNFLSDVQKQTTMTLGDMTQAIPRVGPIMQQLGGTYKDTAVMLVAMREAGIPAAQAANAVKSAIASMIAPTSAASKEFAQYGINLTAIKDSTQGNPVKMIEALQAGMKNLSPLVKEQLIEKLFGKFQFARVSALLENFGKIGSQTQNALRIAGATNQELANLANQEMKQATESATAKWQRAMEGFKATLYPVGQKFLEIGSLILSIGNKIGHAFSALPGPVKMVLGIFAGLAAFAGPVIMLTGLLANFAGYIMKAFLNLKMLAQGGKSFKELLTPQIMASKYASELFGTAINNDVNAVTLLDEAIKRLTVSLEGMSGVMTTGTADSALSNASAIAERNSTGYLDTTKGSQSKMTKEAASAIYGSRQVVGTHTLYKGSAVAYVSSADEGRVNSLMANKNRGVESKEYIAAMQRLTGVTDDAARMFKTSYTGYLDELTKTKLKTGEMLLSQESADKILAEINTEWQSELLEMQRLYDLTGNEEYLLKDLNNTLATVAHRVMAKNAELAANPEVFSNLSRQLGVSYTNAHPENQTRGGLRNLNLEDPKLMNEKMSVPLETYGGPGSSALHAIEPNLIQHNDQVTRAYYEKQGLLADEALANGIVKNEEVVISAGTKIAEESSKSTGEILVASAISESAAVAESWSSGLIDGLTQAGVSMSKILKLDIEKMVKDNLPALEAAGVTSAEAYDTAFQKGLNESKAIVPTSKLKTVGIAGGIGTAAMMGSSYVSGIGGGQNQVSNTAGTAMMAMGSVSMLGMFSEKLSSMMPQLMLVVAGTSLVYSSMKSYADQIRMENNSIKGAFTVSTVAANQFGVNFKPLANYDFKSTTDGLDAHKKSVAGNQTAIDNLTQAYLTSTDQIDKDTIKKLKGDDYAQALAFSQSKYNSDIALGLSKDQALQDVTALLMAAQKNTMQVKQIQTNLQNQKGPAISGAASSVGAQYAAWKPSWWDIAMSAISGNTPEAPNFTKGFSDMLAQLSQTSAKNVQDQFSSVLNNKLSQQALARPETYSQLESSMSFMPGFNKYADLLKSKSASPEIATQDLVKAITMLNSGFFKNPKTVTDKMKLGGQALEKLWKDNYDAIVKMQNAQTSGTSPTPTPTPTPAAAPSIYKETAADKAAVQQLKDLVKNENLVLKTAKDRLAAEQKITAEIKRQNDFQISKLGLMNEQRIAQASGDYLQSALLGQQIGALQYDYNTTTQQNALQQQIDIIQANADKFATALQDLIDAIHNATSKTTQILYPATVTDLGVTPTHSTPTVQPDIPAPKPNPTPTPKPNPTPTPTPSLSAIALAAIAAVANQIIPTLSTTGTAARPKDASNYANYVIPTFHSGGMVQGHSGQEVLALLKAGETVVPTSSSNDINSILNSDKSQKSGDVYQITVNAGSNANADDIAKTVLNAIQRKSDMISSNRRVVSS